MKREIENKLNYIIKGIKKIKEDVLTNFSFDFNFKFDHIKSLDDDGDEIEYYYFNNQKILFTSNDSLNFIGHDEKNPDESTGYIAYRQRTNDIVIGFGKNCRIKKVYKLDSFSEIKDIKYFNVENNHWIEISEYFAQYLFNVDLKKL